MTTLDKTLVELHFDRGAAAYDQYAVVQADMVEKLVNLLPERSCSRVLEIGCGTGLLTGRLIRRFPNASFTIVDLSQRMLARTQARLSDTKADIRYIAADAEQWAADDAEEPPGTPFDLIITGATVQWFEQPAATLAALTRRLMNNGGSILFSTFGSHTFRELYEAFRLAETELSLPQRPHGRTMISADEWQGAFEAAGLKLNIREETSILHYPTPREFLKSIQRVGAGHANRSGDGSLGGRALIRAMEAAYEALFADEKGIQVTYHLLYGTAGK